MAELAKRAEWIVYVFGTVAKIKAAEAARE
jgi:hypothetical protein